MDEEKSKTVKKLKERYGRISDRGCYGCPNSGACGSLMDIELNIVERKESPKKTEDDSPS